MKRDDTVYLQHILDAIAKTELYLRGVDEAGFRADSLVQDGVIRQIEIVGEAARHISPDVRSRSAHVPWQDIAGMRNKLIHDYFGVDIAQVWLTAKDDLPALQAQIIEMLPEIEAERLRDSQ